MCFISVHLARRILHLERANGSLHKDFEREKAAVKQMSDEVLSCLFSMLLNVNVCIVMFLVLYSMLLNVINVFVV